MLAAYSLNELEKRAQMHDPYSANLADLYQKFKALSENYCYLEARVARLEADNAAMQAAVLSLAVEHNADGEPLTELPF